MVQVTDTYPDKAGLVRNVEVKAKPKQDGTLTYIPAASTFLKRHVNNLILLVPASDMEKPVEVTVDSSI